ALVAQALRVHLAELYMHSRNTNEPMLYHLALVTSPPFFFNDTATTEIYTLSLHDALPISSTADPTSSWTHSSSGSSNGSAKSTRSEEHTSELQSLRHLVCRLLLEKKKTQTAAPAATSNPRSSGRDGSSCMMLHLTRGHRRE